MPIFDELEGLLGAEVLAKLSPEMRSKLEFSEELLNFYDGKIEDQPKPRVAARAPESTTTPSAGTSFGLDDIEKLLDKRMGTISDTVKATVEEAVKTRGQELFNNATAAATNTMTAILRVGRKHRETFNEDFDPDALNEWATAEQAKGRKFSNVEDAYDAMTATKRVDKQVADGIREGLKTRNSQASVPGYTPPSATAPHKILSMRGKVEGAAGSAVSAAAAELAARRTAQAS